MSVELGSLGKVSVQYGQELLGNVGANLVVPWRVEPGLPGPLLCWRLLDVLELVVLSCFHQCTLVYRSLCSENVHVRRLLRYAPTNHLRQLCFHISWMA